MHDEQILKMYEKIGVEKDVYEYAKSILDSLKGRSEAIDETAEYNQLKVLSAMQENRVSEADLKGSTGYGYDDLG